MEAPMRVIGPNYHLVRVQLASVGFGGLDESSMGALETRSAQYNDTEMDWKYWNWNWDLGLGGADQGLALDCGG